jgi:hypothetical protein
VVGHVRLAWAGFHRLRGDGSRDAPQVRP